MKIRLNESFYNDETEMYPGDADYMGNYDRSNRRTMFVKNRNGFYSRDLLDFVRSCPEIDKDKYFITSNDYETDIYIDCDYEELLGINADDQPITGLDVIDDQYHCSWRQMDDDEIEEMEQLKAQMKPGCWYMILAVK